jgi:myo-inositol-1(or 4)-monophosphatase
MIDIDERQRFALDLVLRAGQLALDMRHNLAPIESKTPIDFCTEADRAVEQLIRGELVGRFGDAVIGEEYGGTAGERLWIVDPIDGTAGYIHGTRRWCVSLAYMHAGEIEIGIIFAPAEDRLFVARRGQGATLNEKPIKVSHLDHGAAPIVETGWSERRPLEAFCDVLRGLTAERMEFRRYGSGALGLADVACGANDGYVELHINSWDCLAGILLVQEAGGWTNDFLADDGLQKGNLLIAATPELQAKLTTITAGPATAR